MDIIFVIFLVWRNSQRARLKGQNGFVWGFITLLAYYFFEIVGFCIVIGFFYKGPLTIEAMNNFVLHLPFASLMFLLTCGFGGYLLVKLILDRMASSLPDDIDENMPEKL